MSWPQRTSAGPRPPDPEAGSIAEDVAESFPAEATRLTIEADLTMINALTQQITRGKSYRWVFISPSN